MSLLTKTFTGNENNGQTDVLDHPITEERQDEMTLVMETINTHESPMSEELKIEKRNAMGSLEELFHQVVEGKGEANDIKLRRNSSNEFEVEGLSNLTLHSFILKAEELGKNITYTKTLKVKISD